MNLENFNNKFKDAINILKTFNKNGFEAYFVGAYAAAMNGVDAIVFTAGVGENAIWLREEVLEGLTFLGVQVDKEKNNVRGKVAEISTADSKVKAFIIPTDEEVMIARDTYNLSK